MKYRQSTLKTHHIKHTIDANFAQLMKETNSMTDKNDALSTIPKGLEGLVTTERPAVSDGILGSEGIGRKDIQLPRLGLAQKMSPEIDDDKPTRRIPELKFADLFHSATKQNYGRGPIHFVILRRENPRWVEFNPIESGGGIKDPNVKAGDPRTAFTNKPDGTSVKPAATMFYDFYVLMLEGLDVADPMKNVIALSMKSSALKEAKHLNLLITARGKRMLYQGVYELTTGTDTDKKSGGTYSIYKVRNAGWLTADSQVEALAAELFEGFQQLEVSVDADETPDDPDAFNPADFEGQPAGATADM